MNSCDRTPELLLQRVLNEDISVAQNVEQINLHRLSDKIQLTLLKGTTKCPQENKKTVYDITLSPVTFLRSEYDKRIIFSVKETKECVKLLTKSLYHDKIGTYI